jgi:hypothetical protein
VKVTADTITEDQIRESAQLLQFVKDLDASVADWDFTLELARYFAAEQARYQTECGL